ncbi:hypothetical protein CS0771_15250 [Catellatospora sp. IY07-71]|uniref:hypothetical protein n=1 Tax=Catellatospora sp. IY07-71 TaxID=2728827 RepID=UPI001BB3C797|nr:hypothetical protein [Catellatospora sp. IY07-71]BCJ71981.1 hypothetical protein CS0771_15250 [Catellatospora sp. IY07-71]
MYTLLKRGLAGLAAVAAMAVVPAGSASAADEPVVRFTFSGNDYIAGGESYAYTSTTAGTTLKVTWSGQRIHVDLQGWSEVPHSVQSSPDGPDWFTLDLAAPSGQTLAVGTYSGALEYPFNGASPGIQLGGNGRGCGSSGGSFTIHELVVTDGVLQRLNATFAQSCDASKADRGRILVGIDDMPALPVLVTPKVTANPAVSLAAWMPTRAVSKQRVPRYTATVRGSFTCPAPGTFKIDGYLAQFQEYGFARGTFQVTGACTGSPVAWSVALQSTDISPFMSGPAIVGGTTKVVGHEDPYYFLTAGQAGDLRQDVSVSQPTWLNTIVRRPVASGAAPAPALPRPPAVTTRPSAPAVARMR